MNYNDNKMGGRLAPDSQTNGSKKKAKKDAARRTRRGNKYKLKKEW